MSYESILSGSTLIPGKLILLYGIALSATFIFFLISKKKIAFLIYLFSLHAVIFLAFISAAIYYLKPTPQVVKTSYQLSGISDSPAIEINFNKPVMRKNLYKEIRPYVAGIWLYADPVYSTHLYRKLVFYPYSHLPPATTYKVDLTGIRNFLGGNSYSYSYAFKTPDVFDVLGQETTADSIDRLKVIGSFPSHGWQELSVDTVIRIRFNQPVDINSAQDHFSITPQVSGNFNWDGDTLIFTPQTNLSFDTRYTFFMSSGVANLAGSLMSQGYGASFTTQKESSKLTVPAFLQKYSLSCEASTLRMVLSYRGIDVSEDEILQKIGYDPNGKSGSVWGNPYVGFVGNVRGKQMYNGYGVYWEPVARVANNFRYSKSFENWTVQNITESIQKSTPVIVWISIKGREPSFWTTPTGDRIKSVPDEHTVVVVGFTGPPANPSQIIVNDPLIGEAYWSRESFEKKWSSLSNSGVIVY